jgi:hypothetical protein
MLLVAESRRPRPIQIPGNLLQLKQTDMLTRAPCLGRRKKQLYRSADSGTGVGKKFIQNAFAGLHEKPFVYPSTGSAERTALENVETFPRLLRLSKHEPLFSRTC